MPRRARLVSGDLAEDAFSSQVAGLAGFYGWRGYHTHDSRRSARGFPDWVFVRPPELLFVELKPDRGARRATAASVAARPEELRHADLSDDQAEWLEALGLVAAAIRAHVAEQDPGRRANLRAGHGGNPAVEVYLWRPSDWPAIERRLAAGRVRQPAVGRPFDAGDDCG